MIDHRMMTFPKMMKNHDFFYTQFFLPGNTSPVNSLSVPVCNNKKQQLRAPPTGLSTVV
jgi:hypothetical protein